MVWKWTESWNFYDLSPEENMNNFKSLSDDSAIVKYIFDLVGSGTGGYIKIFRLSAQKQVSDTAPYQVSLVTESIQSMNDL